MAIVRNTIGQFAKGNSYWLGKKGKKPNKGSFAKGLEPWNKGKRTYKNCEHCGKQFTTNKCKLTKPNQRFCSHQCGSYRNGNTPLKKKIWQSKEAKQWRVAIHKRDIACVECGSSESLHCDHIKPKFKYPELMFDITNGRLLCFNCHKLTLTYGNKL